MIKVITPGKILNPAMQGTCRACGCEVECERADTQYNVREYVSVGIIPVPIPERVVTCPTQGCGSMISVHSKPLTHQQKIAAINDALEKSRVTQEGDAR